MAKKRTASQSKSWAKNIGSLRAHKGWPKFQTAFRAGILKGKKGAYYDARFSGHLNRTQIGVISWFKTIPSPKQTSKNTTT